MMNATAGLPMAAVFSSGYFLRVLGACWLGFDARAGGLWLLDTASVSALGYAYALDEPVMRFWNDTAHLAPLASNDPFASSAPSASNPS
jgi:hypothetical protein